MQHFGTFSTAEQATWEHDLKRLELGRLKSMDSKDVLKRHHLSEMVKATKTVHAAYLSCPVILGHFEGA